MAGALTAEMIAAMATGKAIRDQGPHKGREMVKVSPSAIPKAHFNKCLLSWTLLAHVEASASARAAEDVFTEANATEDDITRIIKSWSRYNDDASVLLILESYVKTIQNGKAAPMSAAAVQVVAACFALINAQDLDEKGFRMDSECFFLLRRFGAIIERAKLLSQTGEGARTARPGALSPPSAVDAAKIVKEYISEQTKAAGSIGGKTRSASLQPQRDKAQKRFSERPRTEKKSRTLAEMEIVSGLSRTTVSGIYSKELEAEKQKREAKK